MAMIDSSKPNPPRKWKDGDILYAENDVVRMAYVVTEDLTKLGQMGWHNNICVEYISPETGKLWQTGEGTEMVKTPTWR